MHKNNIQNQKLPFAFCMQLSSVHAIQSSLYVQRSCKDCIRSPSCEGNLCYSCSIMVHAL